MVFADPPDPSFLGTQVVLPEEEKEIEVTIPMKNSVGVYGLYSKPSGQWRIILPTPLSSKYVVVFEKNKMRVSKKKGFFRRMFFFCGD